MAPEAARARVGRSQRHRHAGTPAGPRPRAPAAPPRPRPPGAAPGAPPPRGAARRAAPGDGARGAPLAPESDPPPGDPRSREERGLAFDTGGAFFHPGSAVGRDLGVLAAAALRRETPGGLRVLDLMAGSGVRAARYLAQAGADWVWANDLDPSTHESIVANVSRAVAGLDREKEGAVDLDVGAAGPGGGAAGPGEGGGALVGDGDTFGGWRAGAAAGAGAEEGGPVQGVKLEGLSGLAWEPKRDSHHWAGLGLPGAAVPWRVSHFEASRLLAHAWLARDRVDLIDADAFGTRGDLLPAGLRALRYGGLFYVCVADGPMCGGHDPGRALRELGCTLAPTPYTPEATLRAAVGRAVLEGRQQGMRVRPAFSLYASHGPVLRCMLMTQPRNADAPSGVLLGGGGDADRGGGGGDDVGYVAFDPATGESAVVPCDR